MEMSGASKSRYLQRRNFVIKRREIVKKLEGGRGTRNGRAVEG